ncbi:hypothetical protein N7474_003628 [Penicillium riverlandense]|uniref:uncharacterized protein n=1 Tax=Penicillium riverlandense TaxID=1903569 RepID=UPI002546FAB2|nr:uncharacterized protein N7474_003628 [Penicillium riverlandense]KAJ5818037.1 hypothetical protein N7474_003628 [Penicillium riverlandense]
MGDHPPHKKRRNRVPISCFSCRSLKTKCDGVRPVCSTCAHNGRECVFTQRGISGGNMVTVSQDYVRGLEKRLELLERSNTASALPPAAATPAPPRPAPERSILSGPSSSAVMVDANVSIGGLSFTQLILNSLHGHDNVKAQSIMTDREARARPSLLAGDDLYTLPENTAEVLDRFFTVRNILAPVFHAPSARPALEAAIRCSPAERHHHQSALALLNMILALCTSHFLIDEANPQTARKHYDIAMALLHPTLLRDWRLEHVQALVLGARYLQGTSCGDECWNVLGLAIRIAYGLRLHQDPPETDPPPLRETKRRVWYSAYTLDMLLSMIYERPSATRSDFTVCPPEDLDDDCIQEDRLLRPTPRRPSFMAFFLQVIKLYRIVENTLACLEKNPQDPREIAELIMALDEDYQRWQRERPAHLVLNYGNAQEPPWILALRGNMVRILIHRLSLGVTLHHLAQPQQIEDSMVSHILQHSQATCVAAAMDTVDIVALRHEQTRHTMGLDWFNIYYLFNAVLVLVSHVVDPAHSEDRPALAKVEQALHMIKAMSSNHSFARRASLFLQQLVGYMNQFLGSRKPREDNAPRAHIPSAQESSTLPPTMPGAPVFPDLQALCGFTQNLTDNLETQLEDFDTRGLSGSLWTFQDQGSYTGFS